MRSETCLIIWNLIDIYNELESWVESLKSLLNDFITDRWRQFRCFIFHKKIINFFSDHSSSCNTFLSLTHDKQIFELSDEVCNDMKSDHLVNEKKEDKYKVRNKEAEWKNKEKFNDDCNKSKMSLLFFIKKRCRFVTCKKSLLQWWIKHCHCSSFYQDEVVDNQDKCEMHISCSRNEWSFNILQILQL